MTKERQQLGRSGEDLALAFLVQKGYEPVARNYRFRGGELDLVMRDGDTLVFIEVRTKHAVDHGTPLETVDFKKRRQIERTARYFLAREKIADDVCCRFDVIGIVMTAGRPPLIEHITNAFMTGE